MSAKTITARIQGHELAKADCRWEVRHLTNDQLRDLDVRLHGEVTAGKGEFHYYDGVTVSDMLDIVTDEERERTTQ